MKLWLQMSSTASSRIVRSKFSEDSKWSDLVIDKGEGIIGEEPISAKVLCTFIHLSDIHICDAA